MPNEIASVLQDARRLLVFTHIAPDGDAIGSLLGFDWVMRAGRGRAPTSTLVCSDGIPPQFAFLPGIDRIVSEPGPGRWDVVVALDASDPQRLGDHFRLDGFGGAPLVVIDHHVTNLRYGRLNWVEPRAAATAQVLVSLADELGAPIGPEAATCLLTGVVTDTRGFRTSNVNLDVMTTATRLMNQGADLADITERSLNYKPFSMIRMWGPVLGGVQLESRVIWCCISQALRAKANAPDSGDGGLVSFLMNAPEAKVAAVFTEKPDGQVEVGLRSRPGFDISQVALKLGGGGHPQAAGCTIAGPLEAAEAKVLPLLIKVANTRPA